MASLLVIEDDPSIRSAVIRGLSNLGHAVASSPNAMMGLQDALSTGPDLVILDLGLPDLDGVELLRMLRAVSRVPVIVATARDDEPTLVRAFEMGADDFVTKPYTAAALDARIKAVLRRTQPEGDDASSMVTIGGLSIDSKSREVVLDGQLLELSPREFDLLAYLAARPGEVVSKKQLLSEVWHQPYGGADKTVDVHISWLRRKLGENADNPRFLVTVRGVGVKLVVPK